MNVVITDLYRKLFGRSGTNKGTDIDMAEHGRSGGVSTGQPFKFTDSVNYALKITEDGDNIYIAWANPGTTEAEAKWKAAKLDTSSGIVMQWCDGNTEFDNVATDLTGLDYS